MCWHCNCFAFNKIKNDLRLLIIGIMVIERTKNEVIIRLPSYIDTDGLQNLINYLAYKEATDKSQAKQSDVDKLAKDLKKGWWSKNKRRFIK
jgi:hypothetical protein